MPKAKQRSTAPTNDGATVGQIVDDAMAGIERDNASLKGVLPKDYARPALDKERLGQIIDLISNIRVGDEASRAKDVLGRIYEYFLSQFASAEGKKGGEFYTPRCVVKLLVEMLEPYRGRVYDPCCGSSGMFVQSVEFLRAHANGNGNGGKARADISIYGQESNYTTWRLARMNLAIRGIDGQIAHGDTFHNDRFPDLKADFILANPPFNVSDWRGDLLMMDKRWQFGVPPVGNANFAWVQHIVHHLAPAGVAGFVLANGSMSSNQSGEGEIRKHMVEADLVDCMVALPGQLFYSTQIPACLWFLARDKQNGKFRAGHGTGRLNSDELKALEILLPPEPEQRAIAHILIKNLTGTQIDLTERRYISERDWPQWTKRVVPRPHDIVFTYEATLGAFAIVPLDLRCCLGRRLALVRPKTGQLDYCFLFHTFVSKVFQELLMARANQGATVNRIPLIDFPKYPVIWPVRQLIDRFHRLAEPLWSRIHQNQAEARNLVTIRDTRLPKLISGELRVKDAERALTDTPV